MFGVLVLLPVVYLAIGVLAAWLAIRFDYDNVLKGEVILIGFIVVYWPVVILAIVLVIVALLAGRLFGRLFLERR